MLTRFTVGYIVNGTFQNSFGSGTCTVDVGSLTVTTTIPIAASAFRYEGSGTGGYHAGGDFQFQHFGVGYGGIHRDRRLIVHRNGQYDVDCDQRVTAMEWTPPRRMKEPRTPLGTLGTTTRWSTPTLGALWR